MESPGRRGNRPRRPGPDSQASATGGWGPQSARPVLERRESVICTRPVPSAAAVKRSTCPAAAGTWRRRSGSRRATSPGRRRTRTRARVELDRRELRPSVPSSARSPRAEQELEPSGDQLTAETSLRPVAHAGHARAVGDRAQTKAAAVTCSGLLRRNTIRVPSGEKSSVRSLTPERVRGEPGDILSVGGVDGETPERGSAGSRPIPRRAAGCRRGPSAAGEVQRRVGDVEHRAPTPSALIVEIVTRPSSAKAGKIDESRRVTTPARRTKVRELSRIRAVGRDREDVAVVASSRGP